MALTLFLLGGTLFAAIPSQQAYAQGVSFGTPTQIVGTAMQDSEPPSIRRSGKNAYIVWHEFPDQDNQPDIYISRSTNSGNTFQQRRNISNTLAIASDQEQIAASENNVYVVWVETDPLVNQPQVVFSRSTNQGASFSSPPKTLSNVGNPTNPRVAASGKTVFVAWQADGQNGNPDIYVVKSSDAGTNFTTPIENISQNDGISEFRDPGLHQIALAGNNVVVTWRDSTPGDFETFFARGQ
jgi:hypothetical protein